MTLKKKWTTVTTSERTIKPKKKSIQKLLPLQPGDVKQTYADSSKLYKYTGYKPKTQVYEGIKKFIQWYKEYHKIKSWNTNQFL